MTGNLFWDLLIGALFGMFVMGVIGRLRGVAYAQAWGLAKWVLAFQMVALCLGMWEIGFGFFLSLCCSLVATGFVFMLVSLFGPFHKK